MREENESANKKDTDQSEHLCSQIRIVVYTV